MRPSALVLGASLAAAGCANFSNPGPATFREPAAQLVSALARSAAQPAFRERAPAESLRDVHIAGSRVLLDYRSESGGAASYYAHATCGPLELRDVAANQRVWSVDRPPSCSDAIVAVAPRPAILGVREEGGKSGLFLSTLAMDTGAVVAKVPLEKGAFAVPSGDALVVVEGEAGKQRVSLLSLHEGDKLAPKWKLALDDAGAVSKVITLSGSVLVFGGSVTAIERAGGKKLRSSSLGSKAMALDVLTTADAAYALLVRDKDETAVAKIGADGNVAWTSGTKGILDAVGEKAAFLVDGSTVTALRASDGSTAWTGKLPAPATGRGVVVAHGKASLFLVPHDKGVTAFDAASGAERFSVSPFGAGDGEAHASDRLSLAGGGLVILDTARGVAGLDLANDGRARYAITVRSLPHAHRRARLRAAYGKYDVSAVMASVRARNEAGSATFASITALSNMGGGMSMGMTMANAQMSMAVTNYMAAQAGNNFADLLSSMNARRAQQADVALRQAQLDDDSAFVLRPISWATGRGLLVVRKSDGAFREIVTGPPDVYEDAFRPASVAALAPLAKVVVTFSEGVDPSKWEDANERAPVKLVARSLLGYALDEASFHPAAEYEKRSVIPTAASAIAVTPDAARPPPAPPPAATPPPAAPPPAAPPVPACRSRLDCKGGLSCQRGQCVKPACVADNDCGAGQFCSLEGSCEKR